MSFYNLIRNETDSSATLHIDGEIVTERDWWAGDSQVVARRLRQQLDECGDVTVYINSPGGDVFAGAELYSALMEHKAKGRVVVKVTGIAASAASVVAMAGDKVFMSPVSYMMIHDPWTYAVGNARDMEHQATVLREVGEGLIAAYTRKTGKDRDTIVSMLAAETYMSAQKCVDEGFADGIMYEELPKAAPTASMMQASKHGRSAVLAMLSARDRACHRPNYAQRDAPDAAFYAFGAAARIGVDLADGESWTAQPKPQISDEEGARRKEIAARSAAVSYAAEHLAADYHIN